MDTIAFLRHPREMAGLGNTRRKIAALAAVAFIAVGCGGDTTESVSTLPIDPAAPARLGLVSVGEGDETIVLTPVPDLGAEWTATMEMRQAFTFDGEGADIPTTVMTMHNEVVEVDADGFVMRSEVIEVELAEDGDLPPFERAALRNQLREMIGSLTTTRLDSYGVVVDATIEFPDSFADNTGVSADQMEQAAENMTTTVPRVPLSVGATWTDTFVDDSFGPETTTVTTYRLVDIDGTRYTLDVDIALEMSGEVVEAGTTVRMEGRLTGSGTTTADTTGGLEMSATSEIEGTIDMTAQGESLEMGMRMEMRMRPEGDG